MGRAPYTGEDRQAEDPLVAPICGPSLARSHVSRTPAGRYYVSFRVDEPLPVMPEATGQIGIDLGLTCFAAFSDGIKIDAPRPLRRKMAQLKRAQKALSRKKRGSKNRNKARVRVAKIHQKISDIRRDYPAQTEYPTSFVKTKRSRSRT